MTISFRTACACFAVSLMLFAAGCGTSERQAQRSPRKAVAAKGSANGQPTSVSPKESDEERADLRKLFGQAQQPPQTQFPGQQSAGETPSSPAAAGAQPDLQQRAGAPVVRPTAQQLLNACQRAHRGLKSLKVEYKSDILVKLDGKVARRSNGTSGSIMFRRPDKFVIKDEELELVSDGKTIYNHMVRARRYTKTPMSKDILRRVVLGRPGVGLLGLLMGVDYASAASSMKLLPDSKVGSRETYVLELNLKMPQRMKATQTLWIGKRDLALYKSRLTSEIRPAAAESENGKVPKVVWTQVSNTVSRLTHNPDLPDSAFVFKQPAGTSLIEASQKVNLVGKPAPDFSFKWADGSLSKLSDYRGKGVVLCFWALPQAAQHLPALQKVYDRHREREDVRLIAINLNVESGKVADYLKQNAFSFPVVQADEGIVKIAVEKYGLAVLPTAFLIDANGIVRETIAGDLRSKFTDERLDRLKSGNSANY